MATVSPGNYSSIENDPSPAFILQSIVCDDSDSTGNVGTRTANFVVAAGETVKCTFTNQQAGKIIIRKDATDGANPNPPQDFAFNCTLLGGFQLDDDGANGNPLDNVKTFDPIPPGAYDCTESAVSGWLIAITCTDPDNGTTTTPPTAFIDLDPGETVDCTFNNTFVPGPPAVGGMAGLIDAGQAADEEGSFLPAALLSVLAAAAVLAGVSGATLVGVRRRVR
jgi:hypothetical protein